MSKFDLEQFYQTADRIREKAIAENRLADNPSDKEFRALLEKEPGIQQSQATSSKGYHHKIGDAG